MPLSIRYKATYNRGRGLPEPKWGPPMSQISPEYPLQCPTCGSHNMFASAHPNAPEDVLYHETVRCGDCGRITDWYEADKQYQNHYTEHPRKVVGKPEHDNR